MSFYNYAGLAGLVGRVGLVGHVGLVDLVSLDDPEEFDYPKVISIGSMNFDNPKVYGDTSIFDGLVSYLELFLPQLYLNGGFKGGETTFKLHFRDSGKDVRQRQRQ